MLAVAVTAIAVSPRLPHNPPFALGGKITHRFRCLVVFLMVLHCTRSVVAEMVGYNELFVLQILIGVLETAGSAFGVLYAVSLTELALIKDQRWSTRREPQAVVVCYYLH